jgi:6-phosphogluconolactonase
MSGPYQDYVRMTMTYPTLDAAAKVIFMIDGESKRDALRKLEAGDTSIPAARIAARDVLVLTDISDG